MENKKGLSIPLLIIAIIVGSALYRQFNFQTLTFQKPALAVVYALVFLASVYILIKGIRKQSAE